MKKITTLSLALGLGLALAGTAAAQVKMGVAGPITGCRKYAFGAQIKNGANRPSDDINKAGGMIGQKISPSRFGDDVSDPKQGVSVANKFVGDGVKFVIGNYNSGVTMPASEVYQENGIWMITPVGHQSADHRTRDVGHVPHLRAATISRARWPAAYIVKHFKGKKIAVVDDKTTYGKGAGRRDSQGMDKGRHEAGSYEGINIGEKDISALVSKIKQSGANLVYSGGLLHRRWPDRAADARPRREGAVDGRRGITPDEFASVGGPGVEGTLMTYPPDPRNNPAAKAAWRIPRQGRFKPEAYTLYCYPGEDHRRRPRKLAASWLDPKKAPKKSARA